MLKLLKRLCVILMHSRQVAQLHRLNQQQQVAVTPLVVVEKLQAKGAMQLNWLLLQKK